MLNPNPRGHEHKIPPRGDSRSVKCMGTASDFYTHGVTTLSSGPHWHEHKIPPRGDSRNVKCLGTVLDSRTHVSGNIAQTISSLIGQCKVHMESHRWSVPMWTQDNSRRVNYMHSPWSLGFSHM